VERRARHSGPSDGGAFGTRSHASVCADLVKSDALHAALAELAALRQAAGLQASAAAARGAARASARRASAGSAIEAEAVEAAEAAAAARSAGHGDAGAPRPWDPAAPAVLADVDAMLAALDE
jgi:hypothetical protein